MADITCNNEKRRFEQPEKMLLSHPSQLEEKTADLFQPGASALDNIHSDVDIIEVTNNTKDVAPYVTGLTSYGNELNVESSDYLDALQTAWEISVIPELNHHQTSEETTDNVPVEVFTFPSKIQNVFDDYDEEARIASYLEINDAIAALNELSNSQIQEKRNLTETNEAGNLGSEDIVDVIRNFISEQDPLLELFLSVCFVHPSCVQVKTKGG